MIRPFRRLLLASAAAGLCAVAAAGPALACAGLVTPGGNVKLLRASTLAAWADGLEHYVTSFTFQGGGAEFGSIVPLPGVPSKVERGGDWTLQRLEREVAPPAPAAAEDCANCAKATAGSAEEVYNTRIDALDITILRGGGASVGQWAREHGFQLTPDAPEVLDFYADRSPIFMAARFNADAASERNQEQGEGTPVHLTIPMDEPWVPLRILGLGKGTEDLINANVFLLTPSRPNLLPEPQGRSSNPGARPVAGSDEVGGDGVFLEVSEQASKSLLDDLRSDKGMEWVPSEMWLTYLRIGEQTNELRYDLAIDKAGAAKPSRVMAGLDEPPAPVTTTVVVVAAHHRRADQHDRQGEAEAGPDADHRRARHVDDDAGHGPDAAGHRGVAGGRRRGTVDARPVDGRPAPRRFDQPRRLGSLGRRPDRRRRRSRPHRRPGRLGPPDEGPPEPGVTLVQSPEAGPAELAGPATAVPAAPAGRSGGSRRVVLVAAVAGALLAGGVAWTLESSSGAAEPKTIGITARLSRFEPDRVTVKPGSTVRFVIHNADPIDHEFIIGPPETHDIHERGAPHFHTGAVQGEVTVPAGATVETTWTFGPSSAPSVDYGCHLAGHWTYGMHGKALVR